MNKKYLKPLLLKLSAFSLVLLVLTIYVGCFKTSGSGDITIEYSRWSSPTEKKATLRLLKKFMEQNPGIKVKFNSESWNGYWSKLQTRISAGDAPDVFLNHANYVVDFHDKGVIKNLSPYLDDLDMDDFYTQPFEIYTFDGDLYALPRDINTILLYYNKDLFDKHGLSYPDQNWTWGDYLTAARKLTEDNNGDGVPEVYGTITGMHFEIFWGNFVAQNGGELLNRDKNKALFTDPAVKEAFQFLYDLEKVHKVAPASDVRDSVGSVDTFFESGKVAMAFDGTWQMARYRDILKFNWDVEMLPKQKKRANIANGVAHSISSGSKHPEAAWKLVKFLSGKEAQMVLARSGTAMPIRKSLANSKYFLSGVPANKIAAVKAIKYGVNYPVTSRLDEWLNATLNKRMQEAFLLDQDLGEALYEAKVKADEILKDNTR